MRFAEGAHATTPDPAWKRGRGATPAGDSEDAETLERHGGAREACRRAHPGAAGRGVVEILREKAAAAGRAASEPVDILRVTAAADAPASRRDAA